MTSYSEFKNALLKDWNNGKFGEWYFNFIGTFKLKSPKSTDLKNNFLGELEIAKEWYSHKDDLTINTKVISSKLMGTQEIPSEVVFKDIFELAKFLGKKRELELFIAMHEKALSLNPHLHELFVKRPKFIMDNCDNFNKALKVTQFIINNPHSNLYIREVDLEGINTKFIENNRELILYLYAYATNKEQEISLKSDKESFNLTCGFRSKRPIVRFSFIGDDCSPLVNLSPRMDISLDIESFSNLNPKVKNVIICENEITFLSLPKCQDTMAIFGGGYNAKILGVVYWLNFKNIYYWGDLDRDGFAILNNLRANLPNAKIISLMMDKETFNLGRVSAVEDTSKTAGDLLYLTPKENEVYNELRVRMGEKDTRLEQEYIPYHYVLERLKGIGLL